MAWDGLGIDKGVLDGGLPMNVGNLDGMQDMIKSMSEEHGDIISDSLDSEMSQIIDFKLWKKLIELQKTFNNEVSPSWEADTHQQEYDSWMAILEETVEVLGSKKWKWWKNTENMGEVDWDNVQVELIDIFHFMISISVQLKQQDSIFLTIMAIESGKGTSGFQVDRTQAFFDDFWNEFIMAVWQKSIPLVIVKWVEFWYRSGGNFETLVRDYFIKNTLNRNRQEFGYKSGQYQKMQRHPNDPSKKVEDNVVAGILLREKFSKNITVDSLTEMQYILRKYYLEYVAV